MAYADAMMLVCVVLWVYPTSVPRDSVPFERGGTWEDFERIPVFENA